MVPVIELGVFAHNEEKTIGAVIAALAAQQTTGFDLRIHILANGCRDRTVELARAALPDARFVVHDLEKGGKSRTWNRFVHDLSGRDADYLMFLDADIELPAPDCVLRLVHGILPRDGLWVLNSQPVKDTQHRPQGLSLTDRLIAASAGGLDDWKKAVCGSFYIMPAARARRFWMPVGLPVEDGFLRAMVLTDALTGPEDFSRIDGVEGLFHIYESERSIARLIRHQERIVVGSAINAAIFAAIRALPEDTRHAELARAGGDEDWLSRILRAGLPRAPFGYVPFHFLTKRLVRNLPRMANPKRFLLTVLGVGFDAIVYIGAQIRMARGGGVGFW